MCNPLTWPSPALTPALGCVSSIDWEGLWGALGCCSQQEGKGQPGSPPQPRSLVLGGPGAGVHDFTLPQRRQPRCNQRPGVSQRGLVHLSSSLVTGSGPPCVPPSRESLRWISLPNLGLGVMQAWDLGTRTLLC